MEYLGISLMGVLIGAIAFQLFFHGHKPSLFYLLAAGLLGSLLTALLLQNMNMSPWDVSGILALLIVSFLICACAGLLSRKIHRDRED